MSTACRDNRKPSPRSYLRSFMELSGWLVSAIGVSFVMMSPTLAAAADVQTNRMKVEYVPPTNLAHQALYELLKQRHALEKLQEVFSPFRIPVNLTLRTVGCDGVSNARYGRTAAMSGMSVTRYVAFLQRRFQTAPFGFDACLSCSAWRGSSQESPVGLFGPR